MNILKIVIINSYLLENRGDSLNVETKNMLNICEVYAYEYRKKKEEFLIVYIERAREKDTKKIFDKLYSLIYKPFFDKIKTRSVLHNLLLLELKYFFSLRILHERF